MSGSRCWVTSLATILLTSRCLCQIFDPFQPFGCLSVLCRKKNTSRSTSDHFQAGGVRHMELHFRVLMSIPVKLLEKNKDTAEILDLSNNRIRKIRVGDFPTMRRLHTLLLDYNNLESIEDGALDNLTQLQTLSLISNHLRKIPKFTYDTMLQKIDISWNAISSISRDVMEQHSFLEEMYLQRNRITSVEDNTFLDNWSLKTLDLSQNPLTKLAPNSLLGPKHLYKLNLKQTELTRLPEVGLRHLKLLDLRDIKTLWSIPDAALFRALEEIKVTYSVHCCAFKRLEKEHFLIDGKFTGCREYLLHSTISTGGHAQSTTPSATTPTPTSNLSSTSTAITKPVQRRRKNRPVTAPWGSFLLGGGSENDEDPFRGLLDSYHSNSTNPPLCHENSSGQLPKNYRHHIRCSPSPDAFNPCDDVMGSTLLRVCCWAIALLAVLGNTLQTIVLYTNSQSMTVYKCFMYHLAIANFVMGLYLVTLCSLDAYTFGKYFNFVRSWQYAGGCRVAGFLAIFSAELSLCLLAFITLERYLLIVYALSVSHQMRLTHARVALVLIYSYAIVIASLPLSNKVSSYSKVAICLPFEAGNQLSRAYLIWLLSFNVIVFVYVSVSYLHMYHKVKKSNRGIGINNDIEVAKRMALIVFSNFACWMPISVSGFVTLYTDLPMSIDTSKFLLVFIFPINACTNPFLYAFFTKIFKEDVVFLLTKMGLFRERSARTRHAHVPYRRTRISSRSYECTNNSEISFRTSENGRFHHLEVRDSYLATSCGDVTNGKRRVRGNAEDETYSEEHSNLPRVDVQSNSKTPSYENGLHLTEVICHHKSVNSFGKPGKKSQSTISSVPNVAFRYSKDGSTESDGSYQLEKEDIEMSRIRSVSLAVAASGCQENLTQDSLDILSPSTQISSLEVE